MGKTHSVTAKNIQCVIPKLCIKITFTTRLLCEIAPFLHMLGLSCQYDQCLPHLLSAGLIGILLEILSSYVTWTITQKFNLRTNLRPVNMHYLSQQSVVFWKYMLPHISRLFVIFYWEHMPKTLLVQSWCVGTCCWFTTKAYKPASSNSDLYGVNYFLCFEQGFAWFLVF
jgi:hypothetical protein